MKRVAIKSDSHIPAGYLGTTKFTCPDIKTDEQRNVLEAIEIAIVEKFRQFENFCNRQFALTGSDSWTGTVYITDDRCYYVCLEATRAQFNAFVCGDSVIRKPVHCRFVSKCNVKGDSGTLWNMGRIKPIDNNR